MTKGTILFKKFCGDFDVIVVEHFDGKFFTVHTCYGDKINLTNEVFDKLTDALYKFFSY